MKTKAVLDAIGRRWVNRPRINMSPPLMPTWFLITLGGYAAIATAYLAWVLGKAVPAYFEGAAKGWEFGLLGTALGIAMIIIAAFAWAFGEIAGVCRTELRKRLLGL